jgi:hypothetical protein
MPTYRVSYSFTRLADAPLQLFAEGVAAGLTSNPNFPTPRVTPVVLGGAATTFANAITLAEHGGTQATAAKDLAREALIGLLRQEAAYVQSIAGENLPMLLSTGFNAMKTTRTRITLPQPEIVRLDCPQSGRIAVRVKPIYTAKAYEARMKNGTGDWQVVGIFTAARMIPIDGVTPGAIYTVQVRAVGGLTGYSDWSDPSSRMAM